jgi:hypothetical protein
MPARVLKLCCLHCPALSLLSVVRTHRKHSPQAGEGEQLLITARLLHTLLGRSPRFFSAAVKGDITPGLVRALRKVGFRPNSLRGTPYDIFSPVYAPLECLLQLVLYDKDNQAGVRKAAYDAGIVPLLCDLLAACDESRIKQVLSLSTSLVLFNSPGEEGEWAGRLPHAIARLMNASPPVAAAAAADALFNMCTLYPQLLLACPTWGIGDSLKRLTAHSDPETAAAAKKLLSIMEEWLDVSPPLCLFNSFVCTHPILPLGKGRVFKIPQLGDPLTDVVALRCTSMAILS